MDAKKTTVLVVDDRRDVRLLIASFLKKEGYDILMAENGQQGIDVYAENPHIDVIISDMEMPVLDGIQMIKELRAIKVDIPIIILSGHEDLHLAMESMRQGASDYLLKDGTMKESIPLAVRKILEKRKLEEHIHQLMADLTIKNEELKRLNGELADLNQLKNKFLGIAAHDLRNPLASIRGFSEMLVEGGLGEEENKEFLQIIHVTSNEMLSMLNDLLDVSLIESGKFNLRKESGSLSDLVARRIHLIQPTAQKKQMRLDADLPKTPDIVFDKERIGQVVDNFLTNAIKYSPPASDIHVRVKNDGKGIRMEVRDHGPGLSEGDQKKLFGEFQKLSTQPTGGEKATGLGLAIVKKIVDAHGGQIGVESKVGEGSTFFFVLPQS